MFLMLPAEVQEIVMDYLCWSDYSTVFGAFRIQSSYLRLAARYNKDLGWR